MGTNYYIKGESTKEICEHCNSKYIKENLIHIGKSSCGWCFGLHIIPELNINNLADWKKMWKGKKIYDEYNKIISKKEMLNIITKRNYKVEIIKFPNEYYLNQEQFYEQNNCTLGINGCLRRNISGQYCVGHGEGTWDLIIGDFC